MFKVLDSNSHILNAFAELFNSVTSEINITEYVYLSQANNIPEGIQYTNNNIILNNDFKMLINQYGSLGGFSIISERVFQGFYLWLAENFTLSEVDEQFPHIKQQILSVFINKVNNSSQITNYLKYLLYKEGFISLTEKEGKNLLIQQTFAGLSFNTINKFTFTDPSEFIHRSHNIIEAKLADIQPKYHSTNFPKYIKIMNNNNELSNLADILSQNPIFINGSPRYRETQLGLSDIQKSFVVTMNEYYEVNPEIQRTTNDKLENKVKNTLAHVTKGKDDDFSNRKYTFYDALLIISYCYITELIPKNTYFQLLKKQLFLRNLPSKHTVLEQTIFEANKDKTEINKDFAYFTLLLKELAEKYLIIGKVDEVEMYWKNKTKANEIFRCSLFYYHDKENYKYIVHQLFKDYFIYYFKGYDQLKKTTEHLFTEILEHMQATISRNKIFDIFEFNTQLLHVLVNFSFQDIDGRANELKETKHINTLIKRIGTLETHSLLSFITDIKLMNSYTNKLKDRRNRHK